MCFENMSVYILSGAILAEYRPSIQIKNTEVCTLGKGEKKKLMAVVFLVQSQEAY